MPPTYSPFWKPFEALARLGLGGPRPPRPGQAPYSDAASLHDAWGPPVSSPWSAYHRPTLFAALDAKVTRVPAPVAGFDLALAPRWRPAWLDGETAVLLDLPGPVSVAYGMHLVERGRMQPVCTFNNWPHGAGLLDMEAVLGALLGYVEPVVDAKARQEGVPPPVLLLDRRRLGGRRPRPKDFDNRYFLLDSDLPSAALLAKHGVTRVVYVHPDPATLPPPPPPPMIPRVWMPEPPSADLPPSVLSRFFTPAPVPTAPPPIELDDVNPYLVGLGKRLKVEAATARLDAWGLGEPAPLRPSLRKTPFTTTTDPAFRGFRRNAAGGFGALVPEPGSGGG